MNYHIRIYDGDAVIWENPRAPLPDSIADVGAYFAKAFGERVILHAEKKGNPSFRHAARFRGEETLEGYRVDVLSRAPSHYGAGATWKTTETSYRITAEKWI